LNRETATRFELHYGKDMYEELAYIVDELFEIRYKREPIDAEEEVLAERLSRPGLRLDEKEGMEFVFGGF